MIINVRGTSGTGKSTLVRKVMDLYPQKLRFREAGRKQPIGYVLRRPDDDEGRPLAVIGHYETDCGGCDTINKMDHIFHLVREAHDNGYDVLFEGLLITADIQRTLKLHKAELPLVVIGLEVPIEVCIDSINMRRRNRWERRCVKAEADGKPRPAEPGPVNPKNTVSKWKGMQSSMKRLESEGVDCRYGSRDGALEMVRDLLNV